MKGTQNQLERFRTIAKRLVDDHSAELFTGSGVSSGKSQIIEDEAYYSHLEVLNKELCEQAEQFLVSFKQVNEDVKSQIWDVCKRYIDLFVKRNQPSFY